MKYLVLLSSLLVLFLQFSPSPVVSNLPPGFAEVLVAQNLDPTTLAEAPDGRVFITEKNGRVLIVENGQLLNDPFMVIEVDNLNERGLSGIAFDPEFEQNQYIYFYYTVKGANHNRVSRFTAEGNYVVPESETILLDINQLNGTIHNAGAMVFGLDGKLYISVGDGANSDAPQQFNSLLGKILRINKDGSIPDDNPFYQQTTGIYRAIYALGFRNSFSLTVHPESGRLFATEVGSVAWEEINEILPGRNYGWPIVEGPITNQVPPANYMDPILRYTHGDGCAIVGAAFYNPQTTYFPQEYVGKFFYADYCNGYIRYLDPDAPGEVFTFANNVPRPLNFIVAGDGTFYYLARAGLGGGSVEDNTATNNGTLWRVFYPGSGKPFVSVNPQSVLASVGEEVRFFTAASGAEPLSYQWQDDGLDVLGQTDAEFIWPNVSLADHGSQVRCIISNSEGSDTTTSATLQVTSSQRPAPQIVTPSEGALYKAGDVLFFNGHAEDPEDGILDAEALRWKIDFHHDAHSHPAFPPTIGIAEGSYFIPQTGETSDNVWYEITLTAMDATGLTKTVSRSIYPQKTQFDVQSDPTGLPVYIEGDFLQTPVTEVSVVGIARRIEVLGSVILGDSMLLFEKWSDGELDPVRTFAASEQFTTYTALYKRVPLGDGTGLKGFYYDGIPEDPTFVEPYKFTWIDPQIDFDWGDGSPAPSQLGNDQWLVRWEGFIEPFFDEEYEFSLIADDGIRLWIDSQLIIDAWIPQPPTEWIGTIALEGGRKYPLKLEFFEEGGGAVCKLAWKSVRISKSTVPQSQLFPEAPSLVLAPGTIPLKVYPNPASDELAISVPDGIHGYLHIEIYNILGQRVMKTREEVKDPQVVLDIGELHGGSYWLKCRMDNRKFTIAGFTKQ